MSGTVLKTKNKKTPAHLDQLEPFRGGQRLDTFPWENKTQPNFISISISVCFPEEGMTQQN